MTKPPEQIETARLLLRKPRIEDAPDVFDGWARHPEVTRFLTWRPHESVKQSEELMKRSIAAWDGEENFRYLLEIRGSGALAGMIEVRLESAAFKISFGYTGAYAQWGKGYMTEAARACIQWAFEQPEVYRVYATADVENIPSQRVLEKIGMQREGLLRRESLHPNISPEPRDSYMYAIVR
jgi:[ribosomal protein S5]-alanine N-acetyltransferase